MYQIIFNESEQGFSWVDVLNPSADELKELSAKYGLHATALQDVLQPEHLPKSEWYEDMHFIIVRYFDEDAPKDFDSIRSMSRKMAIFVRKDLLLTIHRKPNSAYEELKNKYKDGCKFTPYDLTCKIIKSLLSTYELPVSKLEEEIDFYESRIFLKKRIPDLIKNLYLIKRKTNILRKVSNLTQEVIDHMSKETNHTKSKPIYRDLVDYYKKVDTLIETNFDDINNLMNVYISISSQRTNEVMRTLTVFTAFFLPTTFIVGLYGMNFEWMPELKYPYGYPTVLLFMLLVTIVIYVWFKRKGWI